MTGQRGGESRGGTRSRSWSLHERLVQHEPAGLTAAPAGQPLIWERARGAHVWDVDDRRYLDLTAAFGVASVGHAHPRVVAAVREQAGTLLHAMADLYPARGKIELLAELAELAPADLDAGYLGLSGADAVEAALKTAALVTGRSGVLSFTGAYHGLSLGTLALCGREAFRRPFTAQLGGWCRRAPFPTADAPPADFHFLEPFFADNDLGAVIVEPIQGRAGVRLPAPGFLPALRAACDRHGALLIADEIWTGLGRSGEWFAVEQEEVVPDLLVIGKSLGGGLPISAVLGRRHAMGNWETGGEAIHTSTFSGHPLAAAAARAVLAVLQEEKLIERSARLGARSLARLRQRLGGVAGVAAVRGRGLMLGIELRRPVDGEPDGARAIALVTAARTQGLLVLAGGEQGHVIELSPPLMIHEGDLDAGLEQLALLLESIPPGPAVGGGCA